MTWNGSINGQDPVNGPSLKRENDLPEYQQMLFTIVDSRFENSIPAQETFDSTYKLMQSGFLRGGLFEVNGVPVMPEIFS